MPQYRPSRDQLTEMMNEPPPETPEEAAMMPAELEVLAAADEVDQETDRVFEAAAPEGSYSLDGLNDLVESLNELLPLFEAPEPYPTFTQPIDGPLPQEFVRQLMMVSQSAADAGMERLAPDISKMTDDAGLDKAARQMDTLVDNQNFITFLKSNQTALGPETPAGPAASPDEGLPLGQETPTPAPSEDEMENMFAGRM
jgi:hypothetical protein